MLDTFLVLVLGKLTALLLLEKHWDLRLIAQTNTHIDWVWLTTTLLLTLLRDCLGGRSVGKRVFGLAVVAQSDLQQRPDWVLLVMRNAFLLMILPLEGVWVFVDPYYRRLGDKFTQSVVVVHPVSLRLFHRLMGVCSLFFALLLAAFLTSSFSLKQSAAYERAVESAKGYAKVLQLTGVPLAFAFQTQIQLNAQTTPAQALVGLQAEGPTGKAIIRVALRMVKGTWQTQSVKAYASKAQAHLDAP